MQVSQHERKKHFFFKNLISTMHFGFFNTVRTELSKLSIFLLFFQEKVKFNLIDILAWHFCYSDIVCPDGKSSPQVIWNVSSNRQYIYIYAINIFYCNFTTNSRCMKYEVSSPDIVCWIKSGNSVPNTTWERIWKKCCVQDHLQGLLCSEFDKSIIFTL